MGKKIPFTFEQAMLKAEAHVGRKEKLSLLVEKASRKAQQYYEFILAPWETLQIFLRMIRAWVAGKYRTPDESVLMVVAAVLYFVSPFDLIPDSIPVFGLLDDAGVIGCVARAESRSDQQFSEVGDFVRWGAFPSRGTEPRTHLWPATFSSDL